MSSCCLIFKGTFCVRTHLWKIMSMKLYIVVGSGISVDYTFFPCMKTRIGTFIQSRVVSRFFFSQKSRKKIEKGAAAARTRFPFCAASKSKKMWINQPCYLSQFFSPAAEKASAVAFKTASVSTRLLRYKPSGQAICLTIHRFSLATEEQIVRI